MDIQQLLQLLENDPRRKVEDLADILGTTKNEVEETCADLEKKKIICGYHTVINWDKTNTDYVEAFILVSAKPERDTGYDNIAQRIARFEEVSDLYLMSGQSEFFVRVSGKTMREISDFVGQKLAPIDGVASTMTCFVLKKYKMDGITVDAEVKEDDRQLVTL